ncbi:MAG: DUF4372 domain-containing protein, partial [Bacteroidota bacterium]
MIKHASLFSQLIALIDWKKFHELVYQHQSERFAKKFNSWDHFVAMLFCQHKSTLSYANSHSPWERSLYGMTLINN